MWQWRCESNAQKKKNPENPVDSNKICKEFLYLGLIHVLSCTVLKDFIFYFESLMKDLKLLRVSWQKKSGGTRVLILLYS
jgi:hypothetical protein